MSNGSSFLEQRICLITGTSRGIGRTIAERFAEEGAVVYANARTEGCLEEWAEQINVKRLGTIIPIYFDITDSSEVKSAVIQIKKDHDRLDVLINNAGMVSNELLGMISKDKMREMFEVNVFGLLDLTQLVATRIMMKQRSGSIINIASIVGVEGNKGQVAYSASKGAVIAMTKSLAKELAPYSIRVNAVAPSMVETDRLQVAVKEIYKDNMPPVGMGKMGSAKEIADACMYFASENSSYTTGQTLVVDGGYSTASRDWFDIKYI